MVSDLLIRLQLLYVMIESINNQLKNVFQIEHTRHSSPVNGFINIIAGLIAFTHHNKKPKLAIDVSNIELLIS